jgi:hypothetical protein
MSEPTTAPAPAAAAPTTPTAPAPEAETTPTAPTAGGKVNVADLDPAVQALIKGLRDENATARKRNQELTPLAAEAEKMRTERLTEVEKATARAEAAEKLAAEREGALLRERLARTHGLTDDDLDLLGSGTEDELTKRAEKIKALKGAGTPPAPVVPGAKPVEQLRPGATPGGTLPAEQDAYPAEWAPQKRTRTKT